MKKYKKKSTVDRLVAECDRLWRRLVLLRAGCSCQICGKARPIVGEMLLIDACHIITRTYWSTRWDPRNGVAGCRSCHDDKIIMTWLKRTDRKRYNWVIRQKQNQIPHRDIDLYEVRKKLQGVA